VNWLMLRALAAAGLLLVVALVAYLLTRGPDDRARTEAGAAPDPDPCPAAADAP
jgi:hypothetical protein